MAFDLNTTASAFTETIAAAAIPAVTAPTLGLNPNPVPEAKSGFDSGKFVIQKFNGLNHKIELFLDNSGSFDMNKKSQYFINPQAVVNMTVVDSMNDWVVDGSLTFLYMPEERSISADQKNNLGQNQKTMVDGAKQNAKLLKHYEFRGDGYDMIRLCIRPVSTVSNTSNKDALQVNENDPKWILSYLFSVYEVEDLNDIPGLDGAVSAYMKCIRLKFHDVRYQMLKTTNLEYSTALSPKVENVQGLANPMALPTGRAILEVFNKAIADPEQWAKGNTCLEFEIQEGEDWDIGEDSKIFYTSPANSTAEDDVDYLFANHIGPKIPDTEINDICVMNTTRPTLPGGLEKICITPLSKIFDKATTTDGQNAGELQLEHFFVTNHTEEKLDPADSVYRSPNPKTNEKVLKTFKYGQIVSFSFVDMSPEVNSSLFASKPVYSVDIGKRQFNMQFKNNDVLTARKTIANGYIKHLYKNASGKDESLFLPIIHKSKQDRNIFPAFSLNGDNEKVRQRNGIHQLMYTGLFQNACICFKTLGLTYRESGSFIAIDKTLGCADNDYNNKLYGQYLVVKVDHIFEQAAYMNVIWAVKIHRYKERKATFDNIIE